MIKLGMGVLALAVAVCSPVVGQDCCGSVGFRTARAPIFNWQPRLNRVVWESDVIYRQPIVYSTPVFESYVETTPAVVWETPVVNHWIDQCGCSHEIVSSNWMPAAISVQAPMMNSTTINSAPMNSTFTNQPVGQTEEVFQSPIEHSVARPVIESETLKANETPVITEDTQSDDESLESGDEFEDDGESDDELGEDELDSLDENN